MLELTSLGFDDGAYPFFVLIQSEMKQDTNTKYILKSVTAVW